MNITTNVASLNWRTNTKGTWKALVKDLSPNTAVTFSDSFTGVVTGKQIVVESPTMPTGFITYTTDDTNVVAGGALYGAGTAYDSVEAISGEKTVRMGSYTFTGEETWSYNTNYPNRFGFGVAGAADAGWSLISSVYTTVHSVAAWTSIPDMQAGLKESYSSGSGAKFYVRDSNYTDASAFAAHMAGKTIYFELATPTTTTETAQPITLTSGNNTFGGGSFDATYEGTDYYIPLGKNCKYIHRFPDGTEELLTGSTTVTSVNVTGAQDKLINLTHWFGKGKEPSINDFYKLYPTWKFYDIPYDSGTILNYKGTGIQTIGFNAYDHSTGTAVLLGGNRYQICGTYTSCSYVDQWGNAETLEIDANGIFLPVNNGTLTVVGGNNTDTCVHLVWSGYKNFGEPEYKYEVYTKVDKSFPISTYFPDGMNGINGVYDELTSDSAIQNIKKMVFTGEETVTYVGNAGSYKCYQFIQFDHRVPTDSAIELVCNFLPSLESVDNYGSGIGAVCWSTATTSTTIWVIPPVSWGSMATTSDATAFKAKLKSLYDAGTPLVIYYISKTPVTTPIPEPLNLSYPVNDFGTEQSLPINTTTLVSTDLNADIKYSQDFTRLLVHYSDMYPTVKTLVEDEPNLMRKDDVAPNATVGNAYNLIDRNAAGTERQFSFDTSGGTQDITDGTAVAKKLMGTTLNLNQLVHDTNENTVNSVDGNATVTDAVEGNVKHLVVSGDTVVVNQLVKESVEKTESGVGRIWIKDALEKEAKGLKVTAPRSVIMNQLVQNGDFGNGVTSWTQQHLTASVTSGICDVTYETGTYNRNLGKSITLVPDHVYMVHIEMKDAGIASCYAYLFYIGSNIVASKVAGTDKTWGTYSSRFTASGTTLSAYFCLKNGLLDDAATVQARNVMLIDLTQYFNGNATLINSITSWDDLVAYDSTFASYVPYNTGTVAGVTPGFTLNGANSEFATAPQEMFGVELASGRLVSDNYDVILGKFTKHIQSYTFTGSESWTAGTSAWGCALSDKANGVSNVLMSGYLTDSGGVNNLVNDDFAVCGVSSNNNIFVRDKNYLDFSDASSFAAHMAGKTIYYELATPTTTDVTPVPFNLVSHDNTIFQTSGALKSTIQATYDGLNQTITLDPTHIYIVNHQYISDSIITNESSIDCIGTEDNLVDLTQLYNGDSTRISAIHSWASLSSRIHMYRDWLPYIPGEIINLAATIRVYQHEYAYGVIYDPSQSSPACQKVELHDGVLTEVNSFSSLPAHDFKRCVMDDLSTRHINYYLDPTDSTKKADGTASVLTGEDGDVMVEIPITYYKLDEDYNGTGKILWLVSNTPFTGSEIHPYFYVSPNGDTARTQYVGAYRAVGCDENGNALNTTEGAITQTAGTASTRLSPSPKSISLTIGVSKRNRLTIK